MKIIENILPSQYHANFTFDPGKLPDLAEAGHLSASVLCAARDPLTLLFSKPKEPTKAMKWGNLVDCLWLTPELFDLCYAVLPADAPQKPTKAMLEAKTPGQASLDRQAWWNNWEAGVNGREIVEEEKLKEARSAVSMLNQHATARYIKESSLAQAVIAGDNPLAEGKAKAMLDLWPKGGHYANWIFDLKSTNDMTERGFANTIWRFEYHLKMAWYEMMAQCVEGAHPVQHLGLIWQRSKFPYDVKIRELDPIDLEAGRNLIARRLRVLQSMSVLDISNLFDEQIQMVSLASWQRHSAPGSADEDNEEAED